ncbi:MAG: hypothetical protein NVSMB66_2190 [Candidatus Doudnabacteria bacterium]
MLPPGHIAAGFITAKVVISSLNYNLSTEQVKQLSLWGTFFAFAPDLDFFYAFYKSKSLRIENDKVIHRKFVTHAPLLWLIAGLGIFFLSNAPYYKVFGLLVWFCSWSHFILDSESGIMWLWPFSKRFYPFSEKYYQRKYATETRSTAKGFWNYWWRLAKDVYLNKSGFIEIILILIALILVVK